MNIVEKQKYNIQNVKKEIFRACDIRGVVNESLTNEVAYLLGLGFGTLAKRQNQHKVVVGRDGRHSGTDLVKALSEGLVRTGMEVIDLGQVPTPVLDHATHALATHTGIMVTGSHNPPNYNGFKMMVAKDTLADEQIQALYQIIKTEDFIYGQGTYRQEEMIDSYIKRIQESVHLKRKLKVVVDCGNGVVGVLAEKLFSSLGCDVIPLFCEVDGNFPNHHPDPGQPKNLTDLISKVKQEKADMGFGFDGDGDRLGLITNEGEIVWPDRLMILFATDLLKRLPGAAIIFDVKCSRHLATQIKAHGGVPIMYKTGHALIKRKMREVNAQLAGEMSGHFFFQERWYGFDDACYSGARFLEIVANDAQKRTVAEIFRTLPDSICTPEINIAISEEKKFPFIEKLQKTTHFKDGEINTIDGIRVEFAQSWGLVRASNTTPCLVLRFEADNEQTLKKIQAEFKTVLLEIEPNLEIPF